MVERYPDSNVYRIKPVNGEGLVWVINQHDLQDLGYAVKEEDSSQNQNDMS